MKTPTSITYEKVFFILRNTNDGDNLDPKDLELVEKAANGLLSDHGLRKLEKLFEKVKEASENQ